MGGERETVSPQTVVEKGETKVVGKVRYHEQSGEIHFHDDDNGLKVAIPSAAWMAAFQVMEQTLPAKTSRQFVDPQRGTILFVKMGVKKPKKSKKKPRMVTTLRLQSMDVDEGFAALRQFTYGK
jgi:hypothetical protein